MWIRLDGGASWDALVQGGKDLITFVESVAEENWRDALLEVGHA